VVAAAVLVAAGVVGFVWVSGNKYRIVSHRNDSGVPQGWCLSHPNPSSGSPVFTDGSGKRSRIPETCWRPEGSVWR
jgi:hypothetical protein